MDKQGKNEWCQLARESVREQSNENTNIPPLYDDHDPTLQYGLLSTRSSEHNNALQNNLSSRRLSELSDTQGGDDDIQQYELLSSSSDNNDSHIDFEVHTLQDSGMISDSSKHSQNGMRLNLQERIDGEISEGNRNVHFDSNFSPISLSDYSPAADMNDTTILLKRAQEANWLSFFSTKEEEGSLKDTEWHSLQSSIMQVINRPEPLGYARCDSGNLTGNKSVTFANDLPMDFSDASVGDKTDDFILLQNQSHSLIDDSNLQIKRKRIPHVSRESDLYNQTPLTSKEANKNSMRDNLENKIQSFASNCGEKSGYIDKVSPFYYDHRNLDVFIPTLVGVSHSVNASVNATNSHGTVDLDVKSRKKGCHDESVDLKGVPKHLFTEPLPNVNETENNFLIKDVYVRTDSQTESQNSDRLFVPNFENGNSENQSIPESLFLQSLSDTTNSLKSDIQRLFVKEIQSPLCNKQNYISNNSMKIYKSAFSKMKDYENNSNVTSDLETGESGNVSMENTIRKKIAFSAKKKNDHDIRKEFRTSKPNLTSSVKNGSIPSYSFSSSLQSTLGSGSFCIRKIVDEKIEFSKNMGEYKGVQGSDNTLTNSVSYTGVGIIPQFNLTSLSSGEEKYSNMISEGGTIPSYPSSFSNPSFQNIPAKEESPVTKLLGSTFKKTEDFLKKLDKLELPYGNRNFVKVDKRADGSNIGGKYNIFSNSTGNHGNHEIDNREVKRIHEDDANINSVVYEDEENKLHFSSLAKYEDSDGEILQLSDNEILMEQDIKSASLMEPYISDTTIQSCSRDGSQLTKLHETNLHYSGSSKASDAQVTSEEDLTITDLELDKRLNLTITPRIQSSYSSAPSSGNLETITEVSSPEKGNVENKILSNIDDTTDTSMSAGVDTPPRYMRRNSRNIEKKPEKKMVSDTSTSSESDNSNRKVKRVAKVQKQKVGIIDHRNDYKTKDIERNTESSFNDMSSILPNTDSMGKNNFDVNTGKVYSAPQELSTLPRLNKNIGDYIIPKEVNTSRKDIPRSNPSNKLHENTGRNPKTTPLDTNDCKGDSRNDQLESSLSILLNEYEKPVHGKFTDSPLIRKLELLSKILREAKIKRYHSCTSDSSETSSSNLSQNQTNLLDRKNNKNESSQIMTSNTSTTSGNAKPTSSNTFTPGNAKAKLGSASTAYDKTVMRVCPNCRRRDVGTNCPTPCVSSDESTNPLTLQTWTQTKEQTDIPRENLPYNKGVPRKKWFGKENSIEIDSEKEDNKDEQKTGKGKRERKNTFVVSGVDLNSVNEKTKESTAWFQSFRSDDSQSIPLTNVPDLSTAYLESRSASQDGSQCETSHANTRMGLQEAFQLHKKDFISHSNQRVQNIKDECLQEKHPKNLLISSAKQIHGEIQRERKPKRITRTHKPVTAVKKAWVPKQITYNDLNEEKLRQKRSNRLKMKDYDMKIRERFLKRTRTPNSRKNIYFIERH